MISLILLIFFKTNFAFSQLEEKTYSKILSSNKTAEQLKNTALKGANKKTQHTSFSQYNSQSFNIDLKDDNKNKKDEDQTLNTTKQNLSIKLENAFTVIKNDLIEKNHNLNYSIPYIDTNIHYEFSKNLFFEISFDLSYKENEWDYSIEEVFIKHQWSGLLPTRLKAGYFEYPVFNLKGSNSKFSKKTILKKNLFPSKYADIGIALKTNFLNSFYFQFSWQTWIGKRELLFPLNTAKNTWTASLGFEKENQHIFVNYLKQDSFLKKQKQAFGLGSHLSYSFHSLLFNFKGELWEIEHLQQNALSYYALSSIRWSRLALFFLFGKAHYQLGHQTSESAEYILKTDFHLTNDLFLSLERLRESDTITKNSSWALSIRSNFSF